MPKCLVWLVCDYEPAQDPSARGLSFRATGLAAAGGFDAQFEVRGPRPALEDFLDAYEVGAEGDVPRPEVQEDDAPGEPAQR